MVWHDAKAIQTERTIATLLSAMIRAAQEQVNGVQSINEIVR
jgi:hypothetical protein